MVPGVRGPRRTFDEVDTYALVARLAPTREFRGAVGVGFFDVATSDLEDIIHLDGEAGWAGTGRHSARGIFNTPRKLSVS